MAPTPTAESPAPPRPWLVRLSEHWVFRSLGVGVVGTAVDLGLGGGSLLLGASTRFAAMLGTLAGAAVGFLLSRRFAFTDHRTGFSGSALRYVAVSILSSTLHGQLVVVLRDHHGVPFLVAKLASDVVVLTIGQMLLLRYVVFPRSKRPPVEPAAEPVSPTE